MLQWNYVGKNGMEWCKCCQWSFQICIMISMTTQISLPVTVKTLKFCGSQTWDNFLPQHFFQIVYESHWMILAVTWSDGTFACPWFVCFAGLCASVVKNKRGLFWSEWAVVVRTPCQPVVLLGRNAHTHIHTHTNTDAQRHSAMYIGGLGGMWQIPRTAAHSSVPRRIPLFMRWTVTTD